jgi:hypothetical protein
MDTHVYARRATLLGAFSPHTFLLTVLLIALLGLALLTTVATGLSHAQAIALGATTSMDVSWTD